MGYKFKLSRNFMFYAYLIVAFEILWILPVTTSAIYLFQALLMLVTLVTFNYKKHSVIIIFIIFGILPGIIVSATQSSYVNHYIVLPSTVILMFICVILYKIYFNNGKIQKHASHITLIILFGVYLGISIIWADNTNMYNNSFYLSIMVYICFPFLIDNKEALKDIWLTFVICGGLLSFHLLPMMLKNQNIYSINAIGNRNYLSLQFIICIMAIISYAIKYKDSLSSSVKVFLGLVSLILVYITMTFASRTSFLMITLFSLCLFIFFFCNDIRKVVPLCIVMGIMVFILLNSDVLTHVFDRFGEESLATGSGRIILQTGYVSEFINETVLKQLFGRGAFQFKVQGAFSHNVYLQILIDYGLILLVIYIVSILRTLKEIHNSEYKILNIVLFVFLVNQVAIHAVVDNFAVSFLMFLVSCSNVVNNDRKEERKRIK